MDLRPAEFDDRQTLEHRVGERTKELAALHRTARILQDEDRSSEDIMREVVSILPEAWQYPEVAGARVYFEDLDVRSEAFDASSWIQAAEFSTRSGARGGIQVCYWEERPEAGEGPFLPEERDLINTLAEMLRSHFQTVTAVAELKDAHYALEGKVRRRTQQLEAANLSLMEQLQEYRKAQDEIRFHQGRLRKLASELSLSEARQRRAIAQELHDHIGQALAFIRMRVVRFQGDTVFCGFENTIEEILRLLDQTINNTRSLTFEISPPVLYELGLPAALEWLGEHFGENRGMSTKVEVDQSLDELPVDTRVLLFHSVRELLVNVVKHAQAREVRIAGRRLEDRITVEVVDNGKGFCLEDLQAGDPDLMHFGLFSIRERLEVLGGAMNIRSSPENGTAVLLTLPAANRARKREGTSP